MIIAGPCSAESEKQTVETAQKLAALGSVDAFRAGVWKPRTRPGSFEGVGANALPWLIAAREASGLPIVTEVANAQHVEACLKAGVDAVWIGARTTVNPFYVQEIADALRGVSLPVLVKNPIHPDVGLWIGALERIEKAGISQLSAVHRGFFAYRSEPFRNEPKWELAFELRNRAPHVPIVCDPSHIAGQRDLVQQVAQFAMDMQFDGLMVEVHPSPERAKSDADQQMTPSALGKMLSSLRLGSQEPHVSAEENEFLINGRTLLDVLDSEIVEILKKRMAVVDALGEWKAQKNISVFQLDRFNHIFKERGAQAAALDLNPALITELFQVVHKYSVDRQIKAVNDHRKSK